jgi:hypothetical protein
MRTRPASIATIVIAIGLILTSVGLGRVLPYTVGGVGRGSTIGGDLWAHGTAISPALVALAAVGILAVIAARPTRGGRRAAALLAVLAATLLVSGLMEPAQQRIVLFETLDPTLTPFVYAHHIGLIALVLAAIGDAQAAAPVTVDGGGPAPAGAAPRSVVPSAA